MALTSKIKNAATAAALVAIKSKYDKNSDKKDKKKDETEEMQSLCDKLNTARLSLSSGIDRLISRANNGGSSNGEIIKITEYVNQLAKKIW